MKTILAYSALLLGTFVLFSMTGPMKSAPEGSKKRFTKTIERSYPIDKKGEVAVINKYGSIDMNTWEKNEVKIEVELVVNATSEKVAEDVFETIGIEFEDSPGRVAAETVIETKNDYWWNWGKSIKSDFEINYTIHMPATCTVNFDNKYGNINMTDLENDARIQVKYGNLTMGDLDGDLELSLGYGNAFVGTVHNVTAEIAYSKFRCEGARNFSAETKYSGVTVNRANKLITESKYDNYHLGDVDEFVNEGKYDNLIVEKVNRILIETKYTDLKVDKLNKAITAGLEYGGIRVQELSDGFDEILIESKYAGISLAPVGKASYKLELNSRYLDVDIPNTPDFSEVQDGAERSIRASYNGGGKSMIKLEMEYGFLKIN
jgi:hypothetical protein